MGIVFCKKVTSLTGSGVHTEGRVAPRGRARERRRVGERDTDGEGRRTRERETTENLEDFTWKLFSNENRVFVGRNSREIIVVCGFLRVWK